MNYYKGLHFAIDTTANAGGFGVCGQNKCKDDDQKEAHYPSLLLIDSLNPYKSCRHEPRKSFLRVGRAPVVLAHIACAQSAPAA